MLAMSGLRMPPTGGRDMARRGEPQKGVNYASFALGRWCLHLHEDDFGYDIHTGKGAGVLAVVLVGCLVARP